LSRRSGTVGDPSDPWSQKTWVETPDHNSDAVKIDDRIAPSRPIIVKEAVGDRVPGVVAKGPVI
jgi:hypothetical protein